MVRKLSSLIRLLLSSNEAQAEINQVDTDLREACLVCGIVLVDSPLYKQFRVAQDVNSIMVYQLEIGSRA